METIIGLGVSVVLNIVLIVKIMLLQKKHAQHTVTEEGIRQMVDAGGDNGSIDESEKEMINNIFELSNTSVEEIATHRTDIVAVPLEATLAEIKEVLMEEKYSRIVVYEDSIDNIVGVFHVKDLVKYILTDSTRMEEGNFHLEDIMMQPYFVPFSKKTDELIEEMQREKVHMAIVTMNMAVHPVSLPWKTSWKKLSGISLTNTIWKKRKTFVPLMRIAIPSAVRRICRMLQNSLASSLKMTRIMTH